MLLSMLEAVGMRRDRLLRIYGKAVCYVSPCRRRLQPMVSMATKGILVRW